MQPEEGGTEPEDAPAIIPVIIEYVMWWSIRCEWELLFTLLTDDMG